jgi:hypothetical protein
MGRMLGKVLMLAVALAVPAGALAVKPRVTDAGLATDAMKAVLLAKVLETAEAWARSDAAALDAVLGDPYRHSNPDGVVYDRDAYLAYAARPRQVAEAAPEDIEIVLYGSYSAVVTGVQRYAPDGDGNVRRFRFTEVWNVIERQWRRTEFQATWVEHKS